MSEPGFTVKIELNFLLASGFLIYISKNQTFAVADIRESDKNSLIDGFYPLYIGLDDGIA